MARGGQVKALATTTHQDAAHLRPKSRPSAESGMTGLEFASWYGVWAPRSLSSEVADWLNTAFNEANPRSLPAQVAFAELGQEPVNENA